MALLLDNKQSDYSAMSEINVTPLVDVMLVLLVVFMVTAPFMMQSMNVNLPKTAPVAKLDQIEDPENPGSLVTSTAVHTNETTNLVDSVTVADNASPPNVDEIPLVYRPDLTVTDDGTPGDEGGSVNVPVPTGNTNVFVDKRSGARGADGRDGGGIRICIIWCFTIGVNATAGSPGGGGPTINDTINGAYITTISPAMPGVWVSSLGGGGGTGGDAYGINIPAGQGGKAGVGGNVTVTSNVAD